MYRTAFLVDTGKKGKVKVLGLRGHACMCILLAQQQIEQRWRNIELNVDEAFPNRHRLAVYRNTCTSCAVQLLFFFP